MQCKKCNWVGEQQQLVASNTDYAMSINDWNSCPVCGEKQDIITSEIVTNLIYNNSVLFCSSNNKSTYINLRRILSFYIQGANLNIQGYKNYSHLTFNIHINLKYFFEPEILLKIIHLAHINKYRCQPKIISGYKCFGLIYNFVNEHQYPVREEQYPVPCSFCARFYEWETKSKNGWPLSQEQIMNLQLTPKHQNNKFSKIFCDNNVSQQTHNICLCNEINLTHSMCKVHQPAI
jgi:rubredoxin